MYTMQPHNRMIHLILSQLILAALLTAGIAYPAVATTSLKVSGQVRFRSEVDRRSFSESATTRHYSLLRSRIGVDALNDSLTRVLVVVQDSRTIGGLTSSGAQISGVSGNAKNVDLHQAFIEIRKLWKKGPGLKAGRMEVNYGNQRVFGSGDWGNVVRAFEGAMLTCATSSYKADLFWLKRAELDNPTANRDFDLYGVYVQFPSLSSDLFGLYEFNADFPRDSLGTSLLGERLLKRFTFGLYHKRSSARFDWEVNAALQTGTQVKSTATSASAFDLSAYLITAELGYTAPGPRKLRLAAGIDFSSGDGSFADNKINTYDNLYYTGHKFRGFMDYFVASNVEGLRDLYLRSSLTPATDWSIALDLHSFATAKPFTSLSGGGTTSEVGFEADLTVGTKSISGSNVTTGLSYFAPSESYAGFASPRAGLWGYLTILVTFEQ